VLLAILQRQHYPKVRALVRLVTTNRTHVSHVGNGKPIKRVTDGLGKTTTSATRGVHKTTESATNGVADTLADTVTGISNADMPGIALGATGGLGRTVSGTGESLVSLILPYLPFLSVN
jgi:hypothetical protein